jgi:hypothetical protein
MNYENDDVRTLTAEELESVSGGQGCIRVGDNWDPNKPNPWLTYPGPNDLLDPFTK